MSALYQLITHGTYPGVVGEVLNQFWYQGNGTDVSAEELTSVFIAGVLPAWMVVVSEAYVMNAVEAINVDSESDFWIEALSSTAGAQTSEFLPAFVCWYFKLNRASRVVRSGRKAICGVTEAMVANGAAVPSVLDELGDLGTALAAILSTGPDANTYDPVLVHQIEAGEPVIPPITVPIPSAAYVRISTQNTRKR